jgi:hypothetical protein
MLKPNSTFKLPKYVKRRMATIVNDQESHSYKRSMIEAILHGNQVLAPKDKKKKGRVLETETD